MIYAIIGYFIIIVEHYIIAILLEFRSFTFLQCFCDIT